MNIKTLQENWNEFGKWDPLYAILTESGKASHQWDHDEFFARGAEEVAALMRYVRSLGIEIPMHAALDFGCGVGRLSQALARHFQRVSGVDIAESMIKLAREFNEHGDRCNYFLNPQANLKLFPDASFDFIYSNITLQHMSPRYSREYIKEFVRLLTPEGLIIFQLPSAEQTSSEPARTLSTIMRESTPSILRNLYRRLRYGSLIPIMQMYAVRKTEVIELLEQRGARIVDVTEEPMSGEEGWLSLRYCVSKAQAFPHPQPPLFN